MLLTRAIVYSAMIYRLFFSVVRTEHVRRSELGMVLDDPPGRFTFASLAGRSRLYWKNASGLSRIMNLVYKRDHLWFLFNNDTYPQRMCIFEKINFAKAFFWLLHKDTFRWRRHTLVRDTISFTSYTIKDSTF